MVVANRSVAAGSRQAFNMRLIRKDKENRTQVWSNH
jgi:hypothetical protein